LRRSSAIIVFSALAGAAVFAAAAAYASQASAQNTAFDSNLPEFMKRTESSLLKIARHDSGGSDFQNFDEYSLATTDAQLYRHLSSVDKAHNSLLGDSGMQRAYIEVIVSGTETRLILNEIRPEEVQQVDPNYDVYSRQLEVSDRYYTLELFIPK
jgi:hypothetical protein